MRLHVIEKVDLQLEAVTSAERIEPILTHRPGLADSPCNLCTASSWVFHLKPSRPLRANEGFGEYRLKTKDS